MHPKTPKTEGVREIHEYDEDEEEKSEPLEDGTVITSVEESDDQDKSNRQSQSATSSSEINYTRGHTKRMYLKILQDIQKQKRRRAKLEEAKQERRRVARTHLEKGIEVMNVKIPDSDDCQFDTSKTGLGGALLTEDYRIALSRERNTVQGLRYSSAQSKPRHSCTGRSIQHDSEKPSLESETSLGSLKDTSSLTSTIHTSMNSLHKPVNAHWKHIRKVRFPAPDHIGKRLCAGRIIPWFRERLEISPLSVRFEIPIDVRDLQNVGALPYLCTYCRISDVRTLVYKEFYKKYKSQKTGTMTSVELVRAIHNILCDSVTEVALMHFLKFLNLNKMTSNIDFKTFAAVAAVAERILYLSFAETAGPVPPGEIRPFVESADFDALNWKLDNIVIDKQLKRLLFSLE